MKKILIFINSMQPAGGIERVVSTLSEKLSSEYEVTILVKDEPISFYTLNEKVDLITLGKQMTLNMNSRLTRFYQIVTNILGTNLKLRKFLKSHEFDFYYLTHPLNVFEFRLAGVDRRKMVISEHGSRSAYNLVYRILKYIYYKHCLRYVVPTKTDTALYKNAGFPAVYVPHFKPDLPYSFRDVNSKVVLNIGRFTSDKQQLVLLEIWKSIVQENKAAGWRLHIVGSGELGDALQLYLDTNSLNDSVKILPPSKHVDEYYKTASIFALTSKNEGFGMVLLEAISFGLPCVTFDCPSGPRDIIQFGMNGYLIELNNIDSFTEALTTLMEDEDKRKMLANGAFNSSQDWADDVILNKWREIFKK